MFEKIKSLFKFDENCMEGGTRLVENSNKMRDEIKQIEENGITEEEFNKLFYDVKYTWKSLYISGHDIRGEYKKTGMNDRSIIYLNIDVYNNNKETVKSMIRTYYKMKEDIKIKGAFFLMNWKNVDLCCIDYAKMNGIGIQLTPMNVQWIEICGVPLIKLALDLHGVDMNYDGFRRHLIFTDGYEIKTTH